SDRETIALKRAEALRPRLSTLMVALSAELMLLPGLQVFRNGELLDASEQNRVLPVDGGQYLIEVRAPGHVALASKPRRAARVRAALLPRESSVSGSGQPRSVWPSSAASSSR